jgi:ketol-acid reductoisomerase
VGTKVVNQTGWWTVNFDIRLWDHSKEKAERIEGARFQDLSEETQQHILKYIADGCFQGEIVEDYEIDDEESEDSSEDSDEDDEEVIKESSCTLCGNNCAHCAR